MGESGVVDNEQPELSLVVDKRIWVLPWHRITTAEKLLIEIKRAPEGRRDRVIPLLSQAALEAAYHSRNFAGNPIPVAIVGANHISDSVSEEAQKFVRKRAPEVAFALVDFEGLRSFAGHGLEGLSSEHRRENDQSLLTLRARTPQLFSDLHQWMLKVLLAPRIPESYRSAPRGQYQGARTPAAPSTAIVPVWHLTHGPQSA